MASGQGSTVNGQLDNSALTNVFLQALNGGSVDFVGNGMVGSQTQGLTNGGQVSLDQFATFGTNTFGSSGPGQFTEVVTNNIVNSIIQATSSPQQQG
jgi:hypothetical protein